MLAHPFGGEFGGEVERQRARGGVELAQLDRLDPLAVQLMAQILAQAGTDIVPVRGQRDALHLVFAFALSRLARSPVGVRNSCHDLLIHLRFRKCVSPPDYPLRRLMKTAGP